MPSLLVRPGAVLALALALAYGGGLWIVMIHAAEGGHERGEPTLLLHALRDSTLTLPLIFIAVWGATAFARRLLERRGRAQEGMLPVLVLATFAAAAAAYVTAAGNPIHAWLFEARHGGEGELPLAIHFPRDFSIALAADLPIALAVCWRLARRKPWSRPDVSAWVRACSPGGSRLWRARLGAGAALVIVLPAVLAGQAGLGRATASAPTAPCPAGAPVKSFDIAAIDVDIPLNRFGDHDPDGRMFVLADRIDDVREQEARSGRERVSIGLGDDPIQPLVIRANLGDCVELNFTNSTTAGAYGMHIDGLQFAVAASGEAIGRNPSSLAVPGASATYRYYVPEDPTLEGNHYIRPGPGNRAVVNHGLFGSLTIEPEGSTYLHPETGAALESGWEAVIDPGAGPSFREAVKLYHEIGDEKTPIAGATTELPMKDPHTESYRPGSRAINYRSEPFLHRLDRNDKQKSLAYNSYTFGDPATPTFRGYVGDPTKIRITHAGTEMNHVFHLHGGGIRWRLNPEADASFDYADTRLQKHPDTSASPSQRIDSQSFGPGESYNLEIEGGAGGVQHAVGDLLEHCHIAEHYLSGMWNFWRVFDTLQPDLKPLSDQPEPPQPVSSAELIGETMPDGTTLDAANIDEWIDPQLPPPGVPRDDQDASVWDWTVDRSDPDRPVYLGEPEPAADASWPNLRAGPHPTALPGDDFSGDRRVLFFNPLTGRPAYPLLRPRIGGRAPHAPNGHTGAPYLGEDGDQPAADGEVSPWAERPDGICPIGADLRTYDLSVIELPIQVTAGGAVDPTGRIFALNEEKAEIRAGDRAAEPLVIRANAGDCVALTVVSELNDETDAGGFSKSNLHIHHVQFDPQGSDGASAGLVYDQSVRPYAEVDPQLTAEAAAGTRALTVDDARKFQPGVWVGVGLGSSELEIRQVVTVDTREDRITLDRPLEQTHPAGEYAGTEFVQSRWYPDVLLDNVFFHDHVDGNNWAKGLVGQFVVEPPGSTYHDPETGEPIRSGAIADIRTDESLIDGVIDGSFREVALFTMTDSPACPTPRGPCGGDVEDGVDSNFNLRAEPWADRLLTDPDPSLLFSSWRHGDPFTPLPQAYPGDPLAIRSIDVSTNGSDAFRIDGHRFFLENRLTGGGSETIGRAISTVHQGVSERFTLALQGGAGGPGQRPGDYLYSNAVGRRFEHGAWGILRVLAQASGELQPLPGRPAPTGGEPTPTPTGGRPPVEGAGDPCPIDAPERDFGVSAVDLPPSTNGLPDQIRPTAAFVPSSQASAVIAGRGSIEPLVIHVAAGECVNVEFTNERISERASFHANGLDRTVGSSGVNVGYNPEQTIAPGESRSYRYFVDEPMAGVGAISDFGAADSGAGGLYGAVVIAPEGASFTDPKTGEPDDIGSQVDVRVPDLPDYRDFTAIIADDDPLIGDNTTPYHVATEGGLINFAAEPRPDVADGFMSAVHGDPRTPILLAHQNDPMRIHALVAPGSEQHHQFNLGGLSWPSDPYIPGANRVTTMQLNATESLDAHLSAGAGTPGATGDVFYGDLRRPFLEAGLWGLIRVLPSTDCSIRSLEDGPCDADPEPFGKPTAPRLHPDTGFYFRSVRASIDTDAGSVVHYTTDATTPTESSPSYSGPFDLPTTTELRALAVGPGGLGPVATARYEVGTEVRALRAPRRITSREVRRTGIRVSFESPIGAGAYRVRLLRLRRGTARVVATESGTPRPSPEIERLTLNVPPRPGRYELRVQIAAGGDAVMSPGASTPVRIKAHRRGE